MQKKGTNAVTELKFSGIKMKEHHLTISILEDILAQKKLQTLTLSKIGFEKNGVLLLGSLFVTEKLPSLKHIDISWNNISPLNMTILFTSMRHNYSIQSLNIAYNTISKDDKLLEFGHFIRQNANLQHLDISGLLMTVEQVRRVVKKFKKSQALIAVHLSDTSCLSQSYEIQQYIQKKLNLKDLTVPATQTDLLQRRKSMLYNDPEEIAEKIDWKHKYELVNIARIQQREARYFECQEVEQPGHVDKRSCLVIQRTIAHPEISGNKQWIANDECYCCKRWKYTIFFIEKKVAERPVIEGTFELLNTHERKIKAIDVREFARSLTEITGDEQEDSKRILEMLPQKYRDEIFDDEESMQEFMVRFRKRDIGIYQIGNVWYHLI